MELEEMTIEQLETLRDEIQAEMERLKAQFVAAGKVLDAKRQLEDLAGVDLEAKLAEAEAQTVRLQELKAKAELMKAGGN
jgi:hypothetical protein